MTSNSRAKKGFFFPQCKVTKFLIKRTTSIQSKKKESSTENGNLEEFDGDTPSFRRAIIEACGHNPDDFKGDELPEDIQYMINVITSLPIDDALKILERAVEEHHDDANFSSDLLKKIELLLDRDQYLRTGHNEFEWFEQCKIDAGLIHYHSPYPEVRTVTSPIDDESLPVETFRAYFFGFFWTILGAGVNEFFSHRKPLISLTAPVMQILLYPCGKFFERVLPNRVFKLGKVSVNFNPGPWSYKEQMFATIIFNVSTNYTYVAHNIYVQKLKVFYGNDWLDFGYEVLLMLCSQLLGFGYAGILRKFVIYNEKCLWPTLFPTMALNGALLRPDNKENTNGWRMTRYKFFMVFFLTMFLYNWIPTYLFQGLSTFSWMTWISPKNFDLAMVTGSTSGLGLNPIPTFDWNIIDYNYSLSIPFFSQLNQYIGTFIGFFVVLGLYYSNYKWTGYLPMNSNDIFTNTGDSYAVQEILDSNSKLVESKYQAYSPPFYTAGNLLVYGGIFAQYPFAFAYVFFTEWKAISRCFKQIYYQMKSFRSIGNKTTTYDGFDDPQTRLMKKYKDVPDWWFLVVLVVALVMGILCIKLYPTQTPVWGRFYILAFNFLFLIPICFIFSTTGFSITMGILTEIIIGYALPGNGLALMTIKSLGYTIDNQAESYIADQKLAHYAKIPQRAVFKGQLVGVLIQCFVALGVINWQIVNVKNICTSKAENKFTCPKEVNFYSSSVFWGVIGPKRVFNGLYPILKYTFLIGFLLSILCCAIKYFFPKQTRNFHPTILMGGLQQFAPYNLSYVTGGLYISFAFMFYIKRYYTKWWEKYNYVLSAAFSSAIASSAIVIFFAVNYKPKHINWWGNNIIDTGVDGGEGRQTLKNVTSLQGGYFGPRVGSYP